jgi:hypothetical protein
MNTIRPMIYPFVLTIIIQLLHGVRDLKRLCVKRRKVFSQSVTEAGVRHETNQVFYYISSLDIDADGLYVERFGVAVTVLICIP